MPEPGYEARGINEEQVQIGQIITDVSNLPQQLKPVQEGLEAFVKRINDEGGVCGREIVLQTANDQALPNQYINHMQTMANSKFALVGTTSLMASQGYDQSPPFDPSITDDDGGFVPDIGGQAFDYGRAQSSVHGSPVGSLSPVLVGGGQFRSFQEELTAQGQPCTSAGIVYLTEPTGASDDQSALGEVSIREDWGMGLGDATERYSQHLAASVPEFELLVDQMLNDGRDCVFTYADLGSNVSLIEAMNNRGAWPTEDCTVAERCFKLVYVPYAAYDPQFVAGDRGARSRGVRTFLPHVPLDETDDPALARYLADLEAGPGTEPATFSVVGYASGMMFADALAACGAAPTRECVLGNVQQMVDYNAGGLIGPITPFRRTPVTYEEFGSWEWKQVFNCNVRMQVTDVGGGDFQFRRTQGDGYQCDQIHVARGTPG